jgi:uncharacterized protein YecT (DUF1311 family)
MRRLLSASILLLACLAGTAHAQTCGDSATQAELNACASASYKDADAALNQSYGDIVARLKDDPDGKARLQKSQRAWIAWRDDECAFATGPSADGSIYPMLLANCLEALTAARTDGLNVYLSCEEGDMSCPVPAE